MDGTATSCRLGQPLACPSREHISRRDNMQARAEEHGNETPVEKTERSNGENDYHDRYYSVPYQCSCSRLLIFLSPPLSLQNLFTQGRTTLTCIMYVHVPTFTILINLLTSRWSNDDTPVHPSIQPVEHERKKNRLAVYPHSVPKSPIAIICPQVPVVYLNNRLTSWIIVVVYVLCSI